MTRAGPGGGGSVDTSFVWGDLVSALEYCVDIVYSFLPKLLEFFVLPLEELLSPSYGIVNDSTGWDELLNGFSFIVSSLLGIDLLDYSILQIMFGTFLPVILIYTFFKYFKI